MLKEYVNHFDKCLPIVLLATFLSNVVMGVDIEAIRARLLSGNVEAEESALREITDGNGNATLLKDIETVARRRSLPSESHDIVARAIEATVALKKKYPLEATTSLFKMLDLQLTCKTAERISDELIKSPEALIVINEIRNDSAMREQYALHLALVANKLPLKEILLDSIRAGLQSNDPYIVTKTIHQIWDRLQDRGSKELFSPLIPDLISVLKNERWLPATRRTFEQLNNPIFLAAGISLPEEIKQYNDAVCPLNWASVVLVKLTGENPELVKIFQKIYNYLRQFKLEPYQNQRWLNFIKHARGQPTHDLDEAIWSKIFLDATITVRRDNDGSPNPSRKEDRVDAKFVVKNLSNLDREDASEYLKKVMALRSSGNRYFRAVIAKILFNSENQTLQSIAAENNTCSRIFEKIIKRKRDVDEK